MEPALECGRIFHQKNFIFLFPVCIICKQLLGWGWDFLFSVLRLYLIWTCVSFVCVVIVSVSSCVYCFCCRWKALFPWSYTRPLPLRISLPTLLLRSLSLEHILENILFRLEYSKLLTLCRYGTQNLTSLATRIQLITVY